MKQTNKDKELLKEHEDMINYQTELIRRQFRMLKKSARMMFLMSLILITILMLTITNEHGRDEICNSLTKGEYHDYMQTKSEDFNCRDMKGGEVQIVFGKEEIRIVRIT